MKEEYPIMARLKAAQIISFKYKEDGTFRVRELCDYYFTEYLTKDEMLELSKELVKLVENS